MHQDKLEIASYDERSNHLCNVNINFTLFHFFLLLKRECDIMQKGNDMIQMFVHTTAIFLFYKFILQDILKKNPNYKNVFTFITHTINRDIPD